MMTKNELNLMVSEITKCANITTLEMLYTIFNIANKQDSLNILDRFEFIELALKTTIDKLKENNDD